MKQEHIKQLEDICRTYGVYEVTKALKEYAVATSLEYMSLGNKEAIIHKDACELIAVCYVMAHSHPLRSKDVPQ